MQKQQIRIRGYHRNRVTEAAGRRLRKNETHLRFVAIRCKHGPRLETNKFESLQADLKRVVLRSTGVFRFECFVPP